MLTAMVLYMFLLLIKGCLVSKKLHSPPKNINYEEDESL